MRCRSLWASGRDDLEHFFTKGGVRATLTGPYFLDWHQRSAPDTFMSGRETRIEFSAVALFQIEGDEDVVRWEREVMGQFGKPERFATRHFISDEEMKEGTAGNTTGNVIRVRDVTGGLPGEHRTVGTPVGMP